MGTAVNARFNNAAWLSSGDAPFSGARRLYVPSGSINRARLLSARYVARISSRNCRMRRAS